MSGNDLAVAEYSVADVQLTRLLPDRLEGSLPSVEAFEAELAELPVPTSKHEGGADADAA